MAQEIGAAEAERRYSELVAQAPDSIANALRTLADEIPGVTLDFTSESLLHVGRAVARDNGRPTSRAVIDGLGAYLGETLRITLRGHWILRHDPTGNRAFRASTLFLNPGIAGHSGFESDVFCVARQVVQACKASALYDHYLLAKSLMESPEKARSFWPALLCWPFMTRR